MSATVSQWDDLVFRASALAAPGRAILGIAGAPGAGKSTLAARLVAALDAPGPGRVPAVVVPMDGFHLANAELHRLGLRDRKGAPETFDAAGYVALLRRLRETGPGVVYAPAYLRSLEEPVAGSVAVGPEVRLVVTEGNYLLCEQGGWGQVRELVDEVWFCMPDEELRLARLVARHQRFGKSPEAARRWACGSDERNAALVRATARRADLVIEGDAPGHDAG